MKGNVTTMKAKKILSILHVGVTALGLLAGCSSNADDTQNDGADNTTEEENTERTAEQSDTEESTDEN